MIEDNNHQGQKESSSHTPEKGNNFGVFLIILLFAGTLIGIIVFETMK